MSSYSSLNHKTLQALNREKFYGKNIYIKFPAQEKYFFVTSDSPSTGTFKVQKLFPFESSKAKTLFGRMCLSFLNKISLERK